MSDGHGGIEPLLAHDRATGVAHRDDTRTLLGKQLGRDRAGVAEPLYHHGRAVERVESGDQTPRQRPLGREEAPARSRLATSE